MNNKIRWSKEEDIFILNNSKKLTSTEISNIINRSKSAIQLRIRKLGGSLRKVEYSIDYSFFETMTPQLAHFIGFWYADGNLYKDKIAFDLSIKDIEFLKDLAIQFTNNPVKIYKNRIGECRLELHNIKLNKILVDTYHFIPNKSLICEFPKYINDNILKYFIQGYFEGDGWITKKTGAVGFVSGSFEFISELSDKLTKLKLYHNFICKDSYYHILFNVKESLIFLNWIYDQSDTIKMKRKYDLYQSIKQKRFITNNYISMWTLSSILGIHNQTLYNWKSYFPIEPDIINKNKYEFYSIDKLINWLVFNNKPVDKLLSYKEVLYD